MVRVRVRSYCDLGYECNYYKRNQLILLKVLVMIGPTNLKNWLTFGGDPVPDIDTESLFHVADHCKIGNFRRFISSCHAVTVSGWFFATLSKITDADIRIRIWINLNSNPGLLLV